MKVTIEFELRDIDLEIAEAEGIFKVDEQQIRYLLADALQDFIRCRRNEKNGVSYVERRYPHMTKEQQYKKKQEVWRRQAIADNIHFAIQDGTVKVENA